MNKLQVTYSNENVELFEGPKLKYDLVEGYLYVYTYEGADIILRMEYIKKIVYSYD